MAKPDTLAPELQSSFLAWAYNCDIRIPDYEYADNMAEYGVHFDEWLCYQEAENTDNHTAIFEELDDDQWTRFVLWLLSKAERARKLVTVADPTGALTSGPMRIVCSNKLMVTEQG